MGTDCTARYTYTFMGRFEEEYIYPSIKDKVEIYLRYIMIASFSFFIWKDTD